MDERELLDGLRVRRDRRDEEELDRGAADGMTTPDLRRADLENLGALLARSGSDDSVVATAGAGTASAHRPLSLDGCKDGPKEAGGRPDIDMGRCMSRRGEDDQRPLSVFRGVGRSRSKIERLDKSSLGEGGGLSIPPAPVTQLAFLTVFGATGSSST
jgi:hypothetical protein